MKAILFRLNVLMNQRKWCLQNIVYKLLFISNINSLVQDCNISITNVAEIP